ncbi:MAG: hypothetical protein ACHQ1G_13315, partial [Planctomycetota bacterium]
AWLLLDRGRAEGVAAVVEAWRSGETPEGVSSFLSNCGQGSAIAALEERFDAVPVDVRIRIVSSFLFTRSWSFWPPTSDAELPAPDATWEAAVERFLVHTLDDKSRQRGLSMASNEYSFTDPRVCDVAACALKGRFGDRYDFDMSVSVARRDRQLVELKNRWRTAHGLAALPVPPLPGAKPLPKDLEARLKEQFFRDHDPVEIERHGLSALPAVTRWLAETGEDHPEHAALEEIRRRLSCRVVSLEVSEEALAAFAELKDRPLTADALVNAVVALTTAPPKGAAGFSLSAVRDEEGTGIAIRVTLDQARRERGGWWSHCESLQAGRRQVLNSCGSCSDEYARSRECWEDLEKHPAAVLAGDPSVAFEAVLSLGPDQ